MDAEEIKKIGVETIATIKADMEASTKAYIAQGMVDLARVAGHPGYEVAAKAIKDNIAMQAGIKAVENADLADAKSIGIIEGVLGVCIGLLAGGGTK